MSTRTPRSASDIVLSLAESDPQLGAPPCCRHCMQPLRGDPRNPAAHDPTCRWLAAHLWKESRR